MSKLAINGGSPLRTERFPKWPQYGKKEEEALIRVLKSGVWGTLGNEVIQFAQKFAKYQDADYGIAVTNGTVTLEIILRAMNIGYGDEVIVPPYTFNATASSVAIVGATPVFVDIEDDTYNIDPQKIEESITSRTKAIIPVHVGGRACDMDKILEIATKYNLYVIEDCAHAHGSEWKGKRLGSIGHAGSFSFQGGKGITAGEGGFITARDKDIYERCWSIHNSGRDYHGVIWYEHVNIGTNARMTEWQAAVLDAQLESIDEQIQRKIENASYLTSRLKEIEFIEVLKTDPRITRNSSLLFIFKYKEEKCKNLSRDIFLKAMKAEGIPCSTGYVCLYKQMLFNGEEFKRITGSNINYKNIYLENAERAEKMEGVWLGHNMLLGDKHDVDDIVNTIIKISENIDELL